MNDFFVLSYICAFIIWFLWYNELSLLQKFLHIVKISGFLLKNMY